jgi:hypothetical protein
LTRCSPKVLAARKASRTDGSLPAGPRSSNVIGQLAAIPGWSADTSQENPGMRNISTGGGWPF